MKKTNFAIQGMSCGGCVNKVTAARKSLPGVTVENVKVGSASVLIDSAVIAPDRLVKAISAAGFTAEELPTLNISQ